MKITSIEPVGKKPVYDLSLDSQDYDKQHYLLKNGVITHNTGILYSSQIAFIFTKAQIKDGTDLEGYTFTINIEKSRFVREKAKFKFEAHYNDEVPIRKWSGLFDLALEMGYIVSPSKGYYQLVEDGIPTGNKRRRDDLANDDEVWKRILYQTDFNEKVKKKFSLS